MAIQLRFVVMVTGALAITGFVTGLGLPVGKVQAIAFRSGDSGGKKDVQDAHGWQVLVVSKSGQIKGGNWAGNWVNIS